MNLILMLLLLPLPGVCGMLGLWASTRQLDDLNVNEFDSIRFYKVMSFLHLVIIIFSVSWTIYCIPTLLQDIQNHKYL